jgi:hypothetical protein
MLRIVAWLLFAAFLIVVGLYPAAIAPVSLAVTGADAVLAAIPGQVLALAAFIAWLKHKPAPAKTA